jgi:hypothetical protein
VTGGAAADVEDDPGRAGGGEATEPLDVPGLAAQLVGEVGGVPFRDPIERVPDRVGQRQVPMRSVAPRSRSSAIVER